jgi:CrcB protein
VGGGVGSLLRYWLSGWVGDWGGYGWTGTLFVNLTGAFLIGLVLSASQERYELDPTIRTGLTIGLLGGFTTFSALAYESTRQLEVNDWPGFLLNIGLSLVLGLLAAGAGIALGKVI